ncbi:type-F conjugative transfer system mating-pair stabilization protein TraN [Vibrio splendidus]|uniref:type-F conjugative transfer system mating-pair stabilization protein TraN n=1 Tax=Vibrio splendidus TaxID=29497 RepID=UPI000C84D18B|nr:type-F conjugative transfer system mating-pair stabilization protein TraN [Vibrio splendidus]PMK00398.1 type-F conjugative transfer system mating-pair stabilization protein TraN [Vibrio splendidus]
MKHVLLIASLAIVSGAFASQGDHYYNNVDWVKSAQKNIPSTAKGKLDVGDYCAGQGCDNDLRNPEQAQLNDGNMDANARTHYQSNDKAQAVQTRFDKGRPDIKNDPAFEFALLGQENAYDITHGISNEYVDCDSGTQCIIENKPRSCKAPTNNIVACYETPYVSKQNIKTGSVSFHYSGFTPIHYSLPQGVTEVTGINFPGVLTCQGLRCLSSMNNGVRFRLNNIVIHTKPYTSGFNTTSAERNSCLSGGFRLLCLKKYSPFYQATGIGTSKSITIDLLNDYGLFNGTFTIHYKARENVIKWQSSCSTLLPECRQTRRTCVEGAGTRVLNGVSTYLGCWKYKIDHQCDLTDSCASLPTDCTTTSSACSLIQNGVCVEKEFNKSCPEQTCSTTNLICGETSFCLDGDCYGEMPTQNSEFDESAAALAGLNAAGESLGNPPTMFTGKAMKCTDGFFGFADCCKDGGWGTDLGLAQCNEDEKALGQAKEKKLTISLGSYCASKVLGACTRKKKTYCVYDSKMARIIQEQGNKNQLGSNFGSAKNPICDPITPEQLQSINFEHIDFTDFYEDMHADMDLPNTDEIKNRLESSLKQD